jgi:predicted metal-dependent hydrolase
MTPRENYNPGCESQNKIENILTKVMTIPQHQLIRSKRKTLALIVKPDGLVLVCAPMRTANAVIEEFVRKNTSWIEKQQAKALAARSPSPKRYLSGETFLYLGKMYPLEIVQGQRQALRLNGTFRLAASRQGEAESAFERWYREQARKVITERVEFLAQQYGFQYKGIRITSARTRWGSCSAVGALSFSWRLIQAPLAVVDYVVIHELVHTAVHNHSKGFWQRLGTILPEYQEHRRWLREHGRSLLV